MNTPATDRDESGQDELVVGSVLSSIGQMLYVPCGFVTVVVLSRLFGPADYGTYATILVVVGWIQFSLHSMGRTTVVRLLSEGDPLGGHVARLHRRILALAVAISLGMAIGSDAIARRIVDVGWAPAIQVAILDIVLFVTAQLHLDALIGLGRFRERAWLASLRWPLRTILVIGLASTGMGVPGALLGCVLTSLVELLLVRRKVRIPLVPDPADDDRSLASWIAPFFLSSLAMRMMRGLDLVIVRSLDGPIAAGQYAAAMNLDAVLGIVSGTVTPLIQSAVGRELTAGREEAVRDIARQALRLTLLMTPLVAILALEGETLVTTVYGPRFGGCGGLVATLFIAQLLRQMTLMALSILAASRHPGWNLVLTSPLLPLLALGCWVLVPRVGAVGAALSLAGCWGLGALAALGLVFRTHGAAPPRSTVIRTLLATGLLATLVLAIPTHGWTVFPELIAVGVVYLVYLVVSGEVTGEERAWVRDRLRRRTAPTGDRGDPS